MESNIAMAVINALKAPSVIAMETENSDEISNQSTAYDTITTMKTLEEKFDSLSTTVQMPAERMAEVVENQEASQNKRNRTVDSPMKQILKSSLRPLAQSPPSKLPRATVPQPPATPPPNGSLARQGHGRDSNVRIGAASTDNKKYKAN
jgi:galactitol-specific phosphotransferase system IIB component